MRRSHPRAGLGLVGLGLILAPLLAAGVAALQASGARAQTGGPCVYPASRPRFPRIPLWGYAGAYQDTRTVRRGACTGSFTVPRLDSLRSQPRTITIRFLRDRLAEARPDFGGYRIYRAVNSPDTSRMVLLRRFSRQQGDERTWDFSAVDDTTDPSMVNFKCQGQIVNDSVVTFIDPDSNGNYVKVCTRRDSLGRCISRGDSTFILMAPPGPHDGFRTWYAITYEGLNITRDANYEDLFVPDTTGIIGPCGDPTDPSTCPNLNNKCYNLIAVEIEPTAGPTANLERVGVVPNPFRAREAWDRPGANELHFINLPARATIQVFTVSGDLVIRLEHNDRVRDFERWDLKNGEGHDVSSGIYMYRVESDTYSFQDRFIVIR